MAIELQIVYDFIVVTDGSAGSDYDQVVDTVELSDGYADGFATVTVDKVLVADATGDLGSNNDVALDAVLVSDRTSEKVFTEYISDTVLIATPTYDFPYDVVADKVFVADSADYAFELTVTVHDLVVISDATDGRVYLGSFDGVTVGDWTDDFVLSAGTNTQDEVLVGGSAKDFLGDPDSPIHGQLDITVDHVLVLGEASAVGGGSSTDIAEDNVLVIDRLYARNPDTIAWVINTETGAPSFYTNFEFNSMVEHNGTLVGASPEGLFIIQNDTDRSVNNYDKDYPASNIDSHVKTGMIDWGTDQRKRIRDLYMGYTGGSHELTVETYNQPSEEYSYELVEREASAPRNNRVRVGRGLNSRFWRFTLENTNGNKSQIFDMSANVDVSNRRL